MSKSASENSSDSSSYSSEKSGKEIEMDTITEVEIPEHSEEKPQDEGRVNSSRSDTQEDTSTSKTAAKKTSNLLTAKVHPLPEATGTTVTEQTVDKIDATTPEKGKLPLPAAIPEKKFTVRHGFLLFEMTIIAFGVTFIDTVLVPAQPKIAELHPSQASLVPWVITSYMLVGACSTPIIGCLTTVFSRTTVSAGTLTIYVFGLFGAGVWGGDVIPLIIFRGCQGTGMALFIICYDVINQEFPDRLVPTLLGLVSAMFSIGSSIGLLGGAALIDAVSHYNEVFFILGPIIAADAVAFLATLSSSSLPCLKKDKILVSEKTSKMENLKKAAMKFLHLDFAGAAFLCIGAVLFLVGITMAPTWEWKDARSLCLVIIGAVSLIVWVLWDLWIKNPLVPMRVIVHRDLFFHTMVAFFLGFCMFAMFQTIPYVLASPLLSFGYTDQFKIGLLIFPGGIAMLIVAPFAGYFCRAAGSSLLQSAALVLGIIPYVLLIFKHDTVFDIVIASIIQGISIGVVLSAQMTILADTCDAETFAGATSVNSFFRTLGGAVAPVVLNLLFENTVTVTVSGSQPYSYDTPKERAYENAFLVSACIAGLCCVCSFCISGHFKVLDKIWNKFLLKGQEPKTPELEEMPEIKPPAKEGGKEKESV